MNDIVSDGAAIQASRSSLLAAGFEDAVTQSQQVFRLALMAMSEPGIVHFIPQAPAIGGLQPATYALCLTLLDNTTPVWISPLLDTPAVRANLAFHCASPFVSERKDAHFALLSQVDLLDISGFDLGTDRDPDQSCTVIAQLPSLNNGLASVWHGPGIKHQRRVALPVHEPVLLARQACSAFPRGLDFFFTAGDGLLGLPRSTRILYPIEEISTCM